MKKKTKAANSPRKISDKTWIKVKVAYVLGRDTIGKISDDHGISRKSLERKAKKEGWEYGKLSDEVAKEVEASQIAKIKQNDCDIVVKIATQFIGDAKKIRALTIATLKEFGGKKKLKKADLSRILTTQRINHESAKIIVDLYMAVRKSLGMDRPEKGTEVNVYGDKQTIVTSEESAKLYSEAMEKDK